MGRAQRCIGSLNEGLPSDVTDVMVARRLDLSGLRVVQSALDTLAGETAGLVQPISGGEIFLPIFGGGLLKKAVLDEKAKRNATRTLSIERMEEIRAQLLEMRSFDSLTLRVSTPWAPFHINENDELIVSLEENRQLVRDRRLIFSAMKLIVGSPSRRDIQSTTYHKPPHVTVGNANSFHIDDPDKRATFINDPSGFLEELIIDRQDLTSDPDDLLRLFPDKLKFGLPEIVPRSIVPSHLSVLNRAESPFTQMAFDEDNKAIPRVQDNENYDYGKVAI